MTIQAIEHTKTTFAVGPDGISFRRLKHLGPVAIRAVTYVFHFSIQLTTIPNIWKLGKIVPIIKLSKSSTEPSSYRPLSLLCNPLILLERLILNKITHDIFLSATHHSFRAKHSTATLLTTLTQHIPEGLNAQNHEYHTLFATIDIK